MTMETDGILSAVSRPARRRRRSSRGSATPRTLPRCVCNWAGSPMSNMSESSLVSEKSYFAHEGVDVSYSPRRPQRA